MPLYQEKCAAGAIKILCEMCAPINSARGIKPSMKRTKLPKFSTQLRTCAYSNSILNDARNRVQRDKDKDSGILLGSLNCIILTIGVIEW